MTRHRPAPPHAIPVADVRSLRANFAWTFAGNAVYAACQWGMLVVLAKVGSPEDVGLFALALAVAAPVFLLASLKLRSVQATDARHERGFGEYLALRLGTSAVAFTVVAGIALFAGYGPEARGVILAVGAAKTVESVSDVFFGLFQQHERMRWIAVSMILKGGVSLVGFGVTAWATRSVFWGAIVLAVSWAILFASYDLPMGRKLLDERPGTSGAKALLPIVDRRRLLSLLLTTLPLGAVVMLGSLYVNVPRYFIEHFAGTRSLGLFAAAASLMMAGDVVVNALGQSAVPRLARHYATGDRGSFVFLSVKLLLVGAGLGVAGLVVVAVAGRLALRVLFTEEYAGLVHVLGWLMLAQAVRYAYVFVGTAINAMRNFWLQLPIHSVSTITLAVLCAILVPRHGMVGAAWSILATVLVEASLYAVAACRLYARWKARALG